MREEAVRIDVLIVADDPGLQRVVGWLLREEGLEVATVATTEDALRVVRTAQPRLIIMNTESSPAEKAMAIRRYRETSPAISVLDLAKEWRDESGIGADAYLSKPFDGDRLIEKVREALDLRGRGQ
jgi:DNA-binding response OmpR family regulator